MESWSLRKGLVVGLVCTVSWGGAALARAGEPAGTVSLALDNRVLGRKVLSELWFEAAPGSPAQSFTVRPPLRAITTARDAAPATGVGKRPLIVLSHGNWGSRFSQGWLAQRLVDAGYVVLSTSHPGTLGDDQTLAGRLRLWERARDVSFALTEVLRQPRWAALIDESRIGFVGHSFGGWAGVSLAGGRYDPARQRAFCESVPTKDAYCTSLLQDNPAGVSLEDAGESFKDDRIKAFYIMASGPAPGFSVESLAAIVAPFVVDTASFDEILEPGSNSRLLAQRIAGATEVLRPVGHFSYVPECKPLVGVWLARAAGAPICDDPKGVDRGALHREVADAVIRHFGHHLTGREPR